MSDKAKMVWVARDEFYGYARLDRRDERRKKKPSNAVEIEVDAETAKRWRQAKLDFMIAMDEIEEIVCGMNPDREGDW